MKITAVDAVPFQAKEASPARSWLSESRIANPMSVYARYAEKRSSWTARFANVLVRISTDDGVEGIGTAIGGRAAAAIVTDHLASLLIGEDPTDIELLWDEMWRASLPYGRRGLPVMAISGVDHALWDLIGKRWGVPVYRLLGGACREDIATYLTTNDREDWASLEGTGIKIAMPYGPADGKSGLAANVALVSECRRCIGPEAELMLDCFMAWDVEYTRRMLAAIADYDVRWVEEPLPPDDYRGYERLGNADRPVAVATGEHEYTRFGFVTLIGTGGVDILQPDVAWVGGISEARRICQLASAYHLPVIPHAGGLQAGALHLMKSQPNTPLAEVARTRDRGSALIKPPVAGTPEPVGGRIRPSELPGLGLSVTDNLVELR